MRTRCILPTHFCGIRPRTLHTSVVLGLEKSLSSKCKKVIKNDFRILRNLHAYLQTIIKPPIKFQRNRLKIVGEVAQTMYLLQIWNHALRTAHHGNPKTMSLRFSSKRRGTNMKSQRKCRLEFSYRNTKQSLLHSLFLL